MKKWFYSLCITLSLASNVIASNNDTIDQLNSKIKETLTPFQNASSIATLQFNTIEMNDESLIKAAVNAMYSKISPQNNIKLKINNLSYDYGKGRAPTFAFNGSIDVDITKLAQRSGEIDNIVAETIESLNDKVSSYAQPFGDAIFVVNEVTSRNQDAEGHDIGFTALVVTKVDVERSIPTPDFISTVLSIEFNIKTGIKVNALLVGNPEAYGFMKIQYFLKTSIDHVLAYDKEAIGSIEMLFTYLDEYSSRGVPVAS